MRLIALFTLFSLVFPAVLGAQPATPSTDGPGVNAGTLSGLALRGIGPAVMGGRIADIAVDPRRSSTWYVAVGSGGVWKTTNAGITWTPIFDDQPSYSIGCVTLDPSNPDVVWVGTGENVSGRHVGWGDGVSKSLDGGKTWTHVGLGSSEHIGEIAVDPRDGNVVYVAAEGPLWAAGGERGLYKTLDGGASWTLVLEIDTSVADSTGVTDVELDPRDPDTVYAASYQRRRHVWSLMAGGPGSGIHKSTDGGRTWRRITRGLPNGDMGKIGLAVSPADPDVVYATIEAGTVPSGGFKGGEDSERGFYRSLDRGESWEKRNSYISGGTGPHYYQEIVASPHDVGRVYQMDVFLHTTADGGKTFKILGTGREKHSDNHAFWIDPRDAQHLVAGTDGGLYETFDHGATWRHFGNLPISQFYKLALDGAEPFYNVLGGAQDLGTLLGPSRTTNRDGVRNQDWSVPLGADGYACAFDAADDDILYMEWQGGNLNRVDRRTWEVLDIQPQPAPEDPPERWNWDAPLVVSEHAPGRLYFGSQRVWRSDDRGDSWTPLSGDLTRGENRYEMPVGGRVHSVDALYGNTAMSLYATLTALAESPRVEGLVYAGSDDGLVHVFDGTEWRPAAAAPGVPELAFVNDLAASLHGDDTVFVAFDAHKLGDFRPLLFASDDRGRSWRSISGDLPENAVVWSVVQDHVEENLLFAGTEFGLYFTADGGGRWLKLEGGMPTIALRDLAVQRRDGDVVAASFGRGFFVLDDYTPLREAARLGLDVAFGEDRLFPVRDAWWYVPSVPMQAAGSPSQGSAAWAAPNPPFGAVLTYAIAEKRKTAKEERRDREKKLAEDGKDVPFPGWETLSQEALDGDAKVLLTILDADGNAVRRLEGPASPGVHRVAWDLRRPAPDPVDLSTPEFRPPWAGDPQGPLVAPGRYRAALAVLDDGELTAIGEPQELTVKPVPGALQAPDYVAVAAFQAETAELLRRVGGAGEELGRAGDRLRHLRPAVEAAPGASAELFARLETLEARLAELRKTLWGDRVRDRLEEAQVPSIAGRAHQVAGGHWQTRQAPTATQRREMELARSAFDAFAAELKTFLGEDLAAFEAGVEKAGGAWTPGRRLPAGDER